jgi:hypothetical protein
VCRLTGRHGSLCHGDANLSGVRSA